MSSNLDGFRKDLVALIDHGEQLNLAIQAECFPEEFAKAARKQLGDKAKETLGSLPSLSEAYQPWYSEAKTLIKQLLPDRLADFVRHYEKPKPRKAITYENYRFEDYLQGLHVTRGYQKEKVVGPDAAIPHLRQQLAILRAVETRFTSSLYDIKQLVQADLFDCELDAASELLKSKFTRAAGALAGVVLERHLLQVCDNHNIKITKRAPGISNLNNALKENGVADVPQWRFIQHLTEPPRVCRRLQPVRGLGHEQTEAGALRV